MARNAYKVDYHVVGAVYLDEGRELSGPDFASLWSKTRCFGDYRGAGGFFHEGEEPTEEKDLELGAVEPLTNLLGVGGQRPIFGGGTYARQMLARGSTVDSDFYFEHSPSSRCFRGTTLPHFHMAISADWFERTGAEVVLKMFRDQFEVADRYCPRYGLIDVSPATDCYAGLVYGSTFFGNSPLHRYVENSNWIYAGSKRRDKARGIYWGNYFGSAILNQLGGRDAFLRRFREEIVLRDGSEMARVWEFTNGVLVTIGSDPLECRPGVPLNAPALSWLIMELGTHGVLDSWSHWSDVRYLPTGPTECENLAIIFPFATKGPSRLTCQTDDLTEDDREMISSAIARVKEMARNADMEPSDTMDPRYLDAVFFNWLHAWHEGKTSPDPNPAISALGLSFGQYVVDSLQLQWKRIADTSSSGVGIKFDANMATIALFPTHFVSKRLPAGDRNIFSPFFDNILRPASVRQRR